MGGKGGKLGAAVEKKVMPVETDPHKLVNYVCGSNIYIKGEDIKVRALQNNCRAKRNSIFFNILAKTRK